MLREPNDVREELAANIAADALAPVAHLLSAEELALVRLALLTDLLFDPRCRDLLIMAAADQAPVDESGEVGSGSATDLSRADGSGGAS